MSVFAAYAAARHIVFAGAIVSAVFAFDGIVAGCGMATTFVKVLLVAAIRSMVPPLSIRLLGYIH